MVKSKNVKIFIELLLAVTLAVFIIYYSLFKSSIISMNCNGNTTFYKDDMKMTISARINYYKNSGVIYLSGLISSNDIPLTKIERAISFTSTNIDDRFKWTSVNITPSMEENINQNLSEKWLPSFYLKKSSEVDYYINKLNINSFLISGELIPYSICSKQ